LGPIDPDLARALGIMDDDDAAPPSPERGEPVPDLIRGSAREAHRGGVNAQSDQEPEHSTTPVRSRFARSTSPFAGEVATGVGATARSLERLLREGRPEFAEKPWTPHRPPRPDKTEGGRRLIIKSAFEPKGDQPQAIDELVEGVGRNDRTQVLLGVTGS